MRRVVWGLVLLLVVIHQDLWFWNDDRLVFGFLPITLAFHAAISIAASIVWFLAIGFAWPEGLDGETIAESADPGNPDSSVSVVDPNSARITYTKSASSSAPQSDEEGGAA